MAPRADDRHHALDAMVINFLPQWTRHAEKEHFFRFPEPVEKNAHFRLADNEGTLGSRVRRVSIQIAPDTEYRDLSKDHSGAFRKRKAEHRGQVVFLDAKRKPRVRPVYVFESVAEVQRELDSDVGVLEVVGFFQAGCTVRLKDDVTHASKALMAGRYVLDKIESDGRATLSDGTDRDPVRITLTALLKAGFHREPRGVQ